MLYYPETIEKQEILKKIPAVRGSKMEKDLNTNRFFSDNERYADIINGIGCNGLQVVKGNELLELDTRTDIGRTKGFSRKFNWKKNLYRDLIRKTSFGVNFAIIGIENQEEIDYALPLRTMIYDAGAYEKQLTQIRKTIRQNFKGLSKGEFLYGFRKTSRLYPTITFILYYGEKEWDGARDIHGMLDFTDIPESLRDKISNYQIQLVEVRKLKDTSVFKTDVRQVFDYIRYSDNQQKLEELVKKDEYRYMEEEACDMVTAYIGAKKLKLNKKKYMKDSKVDMCKGLQDWISKERSEGCIEGQVEERQRMNQLILMLSEQARMEDLVRAAKDKEYQERLFEELGL